MSKIITHNGTAHLDEITAIAALHIASPDLKNIPILRTRDISEKQLNDKKTIIVDVGSRYEPQKLNFDHHQNESPVRNLYEPYAAAGLIWKAFGVHICRKFVNNKLAKKVSNEIDSKIIKFIDLIDSQGTDYNAVKDPKQLAKISGIGTFISMSVKDDKTFLKAIQMMENYLIETIKETEKRIIFSEELLKNPPDTPFLEISEEGYYWKKPLKFYPKVKYVFFKRKKDNTWAGQTVTSKKLFPTSWYGKTNKDLENTTGVKGSVFCHKTGFYAVAKTKEQITSLIKKSL